MKKAIVALIIIIALTQTILAAEYYPAMRKIQKNIANIKEEGTRPGNEPFLLSNRENDTAGIIFFHGFTASPWEVRELSEYLHNNSLTVYGPLIAGHGTRESNLKETEWEDWYQTANESYNMMRTMFDCIYVGGMSTGGALALMLAAEYDVCGVVSIGTPIFFQDWKIKYAWLFKYVLPYAKRELSDDVKPYYYEKRPLAAVAELYELIQELKPKLNKVDEPIILIHSLKDQTIDPISADYIMENISSTDKTFIWFNEGQHVIIKDNQREEVFKFVAEFIHEQNNNNNH